MTNHDAYEILREAHLALHQAALQPGTGPAAKASLLAGALVLQVLAKGLILALSAPLLHDAPNQKGRDAPD